MSYSSQGLLSEATLIANEFDVLPGELSKITDYFLEQLREGLKYKYDWQLPSYVTKLPEGSEKGTFLAIDLGGTNCRICSVDLHGNSTFTVAQSKKTVPASLRINSSYQPLFSFIASHLAEFLESSGLYGQKLNSEDKDRTRTFRLAFTFSFACEQTSLENGILIQWDKGWDIPTAIGKNPCEMLQEAIDGMGLPVDVCVLANDSVGTLMAGSYVSRCSGSVLAGVIFGTGTNAAYVEKVSNIQRLQRGWHQSSRPGVDEMMIVNTEWGRFGDDSQILPKTIFDDLLDAISVDPGKQLLEKRVSGLYLGELLRLVLLRLKDSSGFDMVVAEDSLLFQPGSIGGLFLSKLAQYSDDDLHGAAEQITDTLSAKKVSLDDVRAVRMLAAAIVRRAARLGGASLAAIIIQSDRLNRRSLSSKAECQSKLSEVQTLHRSKGSALLQSVYRYFARFLRRTFEKFGLSWVVRNLRSYFIARDLAQSTSDDSSKTDPIGIHVDGSLIEFYPSFVTEMRSALREIPSVGAAGEKRIQIRLAKDGSGVGAALIAQAMENR